MVSLDPSSSRSTFHRKIGKGVPIIFRYLTKRQIFFLFAWLVVTAVAITASLVSKESGPYPFLVFTVVAFILLAAETLINEYYKRRAKRVQSEWIDQVKALTNEVRLPEGCSLEGVADMLEPEEKRRLLERLGQRPRVRDREVVAFAHEPVAGFGRPTGDLSTSPGQRRRSAVLFQALIPWHEHCGRVRSRSDW